MENSTSRKLIRPEGETQIKTFRCPQHRAKPPSVDFTIPNPAHAHRDVRAAHLSVNDRQGSQTSEENHCRKRKSKTNTEDRETWKK